MIPTGFKPLLAVDINKVKKQPKNRLLSMKLDGIRCTIFGGVAYSRTLKPIPNKYIQSCIHSYRSSLEGLDCEIIIGSPTAKDVFSVTTSVVMSHDKEEEFKIYGFDTYSASSMRFNDRLKYTEQKCAGVPFAEYLEHELITSEEHFRIAEEKAIAAGYEGVMLRDADAPYKCGRSGTIEPELQKVKRFVDAEFKIVGFEPKYHNANPAETNELGRTKRSTAMQGLIALEELGALVLELPDGATFSCGSGFDAEQRKTMWNTRELLLGKKCTVKYFEVGMQDGVPRFPVFKGLRWVEDIS